jgi:hypothetical protein
MKGGHEFIYAWGMCIFLKVKICFGFSRVKERKLKKCIKM